MDLAAAVTARFLAVNGSHPMTPEDDAYVDEWFAPLEAVATDVDEARRLMLANRLPLPGYLRSDGTQMVPRDLLALTERAGGAELLPAWFASRFDDPKDAVESWDSYLAGHWVCLRSVTPENMRRKEALVSAIGDLLAEPQPASREWLTCLHAAVDELDELEPPFAPYDRLRFGGPVSRDRLIDEPRRRWPVRLAE
jgi:uncharacterized protein DUF6058